MPHLPASSPIRRGGVHLLLGISCFQGIFAYDWEQTYCLPGWIQTILSYKIISFITIKVFIIIQILIEAN
jgi:hypothetical protein